LNSFTQHWAFGFPVVISANMGKQKYNDNQILKSILMIFEAGL